MRNRHPFVQDGRLFARNGEVGDLDALDKRLEALGATALVLGDTDSEQMEGAFRQGCQHVRVQTQRDLGSDAVEFVDGQLDGS